MSNYTRVIPRDLFNEAKLLKCLGKLCILAESTPGLTVTHDGEPFDIWQDESSGGLFCLNVKVEVLNGGGLQHCWLPYNSREDWPLMSGTGDGDECNVFDCYGKAFTPEFLKLITP